MILTAQQIRAFFPGAPVYVADLDYAAPTRDWIIQKFYPWFWQMRTALGLRAYNRRNDCDNFARAAAQAAEDCHALTAETAAPSAKAEGLAVGEFFYVKGDGSGNHAICVAIVEGNALLFFEPQNGNELKLTSTEIQSCFFIRF